MEMRHCPKCGKQFNPGDQVCANCGFVFPFTTDTVAPGTILQGKYQIEKLMHSGGMGYVYLALDKKLQRKCIIKQVKEKVKSDSHLAKLEAEALHMAKISHPGVAMVLDHFVEEPYYFLVVEYISGKTLSQIFEGKNGKLNEQEVIQWAISICDAISYIHKKGIIHRDISPDNIMLTDEGYLKLVDFGTMRELKEISAGKVSREGKFGFTPPEQWQGKAVEQSDIFAIGATIYYLLTGYLPLSEEYKNHGKAQTIDYNPDYPPIRTVNPDISTELQSILNNILNLEIGKRYSSVEILKSDLIDHTAEKPVRKQKPAVSADGPILDVETEQLDFNNIEKGHSPLKKVLLKNTGSGLLLGSITANEPWIEVNPKTVEFDTSHREIWVKINHTLLPDSIKNSGLIQIQSNGGIKYITVNVTTAILVERWASSAKSKRSRKGLIAGIILGFFALTVGLPIICAVTAVKPPELTVDTPALYFNDELVNNVSTYKFVTLSNTGEEALSGTITADKNWLCVLPEQVNIEKEGSIDISVWADTNDLEYKYSDTGNIIIKTNGGDSSIPVYLTTTEIIFEDNFSNQNSGWNTYTHTDRECKYYMGGLRLTNKNSGYEIYTWNDSKIGKLKDFKIEVDVNWLNDGGYNIYGILFRKQDMDNSYGFLIGGENYTVGKFMNKDDYLLKPITTDDVLNSGTEVNKLKIICKGSQILCYANNKLLADVKDTAFSEGEIHLFVYKTEEDYSWQEIDADALFDNIKITAP